MKRYEHSAEEIEMLLKNLQAPDRVLRLRVLDNLAFAVDNSSFCDSQQLVEALLPLLRDTDDTIQRKAISILGQLKNPRAISYLLELFDEVENFIADSAANSLLQFGEGALVPLEVALFTPESTRTTQIWSAWCISHIGGPAAFKILVEALKNKTPAIREAAALNLGFLKNSPRALPGLEGALKDENPEVRWYVTAALGILDPGQIHYAPGNTPFITSRFFLAGD